MPNLEEIIFDQDNLESLARSGMTFEMKGTIRNNLESIKQGLIKNKLTNLN